jgi:hypothetical protein
VCRRTEREAAKAHHAGIRATGTSEEQHMSSNRIDSGPVDRTNINMNEPFEVRYWSKELGVSASQLKAVVQKVGSEMTAVRQELATLGNKSWQI